MDAKFNLIFAVGRAFLPDNMKYLIELPFQVLNLQINAVILIISTLKKISWGRSGFDAPRRAGEASRMGINVIYQHFVESKSAESACESKTSRLTEWSRLTRTSKTTPSPPL